MKWVEVVGQVVEQSPHNLVYKWQSRPHLTAGSSLHFMQLVSLTVCPEMRVLNKLPHNAAQLSFNLVVWGNFDSFDSYDVLQSWISTLAACKMSATLHITGTKNYAYLSLARAHLWISNLFRAKQIWTHLFELKTMVPRKTGMTSTQYLKGNKWISQTLKICLILNCWHKRKC